MLARSHRRDPAAELALSIARRAHHGTLLRLLARGSVMRLRIFAALLLMLAAAQPTGAHGEARVALVIGNSNYQDENSPLTEPVKDAQALAEELRQKGFDVELGENLTVAAMREALKRLNDRASAGSAVLLFFSGYGIQAERQTYLMPVDAHVWSDAEVRRDGISLEAILAEISTRDPSAEIVVVDASRRNPFERRFRKVPRGLAPVAPPSKSLVLYSTAPGLVTDDRGPDGSLFVRELLKEISAEHATAEETFIRTRANVQRASQNAQIPWLSNLLTEPFSFGPKGYAGSTNNEPTASTPTQRGGVRHRMV
jgi:uncharacterized caspase-like protein